MTNLLKALAKSYLMLLTLTAAASTRDATIPKRILGFCMTKLIISNKEMGDIMKIIKSLRECSLLIQGVGGIIKIKAKKKTKSGVLLMSLGTLVASLLGNLLTGKKIKSSNIPEREVMRAGHEMMATSRERVTIRAGQNF